MSRTHVVVALVLSGAFAELGCTGPGNAGVETSVSALTCAYAGSSGALGGSTGYSSLRAVRGFTRSDGVHEAAFHEDGTSNILTASGTPLGNLTLLAAPAKAGTTAWGYKRHDGPNIVLYIDQNGHIHEFGSADTDFNTCCGINAPIAASRDVIGYVRSDGKSGLVYRSTNNHVIEVTSNFSGWPPWVANDVTVLSAATVTAIGDPFPSVMNAGNGIAYVGSDNHIHLATTVTGVNWYDDDLHAASHETTLPAADPWTFHHADNSSGVVWVGTDLKLRQFVVDTNWISVLLPAVEPVKAMRPSAYVAPNGATSVVYLSGTSIASLHQLTQSGTTWTDELLLGANCVRPYGEPFGHTAPGNLSSILFTGVDEMRTVRRYELSKPVGGSWTLATF